MEAFAKWYAAVVGTIIAILVAFYSTSGALVLCFAFTVLMYHASVYPILVRIATALEKIAKEQ